MPLNNKTNKQIKLQWEVITAKARMIIIVMICGFGKLTQKEYQTKNDWVRKVIKRELCKRLKSEHANKLDIHKPESILENYMYELI